MCACKINVNALCMFYSIYNLELTRFVCYVIITHKIRATMDLLPITDEIRVGLANCDHLQRFGERFQYLHHENSSMDQISMFANVLITYLTSSTCFNSRILGSGSRFL